MKWLAAVLAPTLLAALDCRADNCEAIKSQVEARFRAGGLAEVGLVIVDAGGSKPGRVVGTCANGARQIVLAAPGRPVDGAGPASAPASAAPASVAASAVAPRQAASSAGESSADRIPTECKDGSIVIGPDCSDPLAPRLTKSELSKLVATPP